MQDWYHEPDLLIDMSDVFEQRMKSIEAYTTQFHRLQDTDRMIFKLIYQPPISWIVLLPVHGCLEKRIGVKYAEGFISEKKIGICEILTALVLNET